MLDENRVLVARGLRVLNGAPRLGLQALVTCASLSIGRLDEGHIGFAIGPRLNAAGRMAEAELAYRLLRTADAGQAALLAERLNALNAARQQATENALVALEPHLAQLRPADSLVLVHEAGVPAGIVGLVASRLCDSFDRPAIVFTGDGEQLKGSGRSVMGFNLAEALAACDDLLIRHGGHYLAAGLTVERELFPALRERLLLLGTKALGDRVGVGELRVDAVLGGKDIGWPLYEQLQRLRPFGAGNAEPVFVSRGLHVVERSAIGRTLGTLRLRLKDQSGGGFITAKGFGMGHRVAEVGETVDVAYNLSRNDWRGNSTLELNLVDFRPA